MPLKLAGAAMESKSKVKAASRLFFVTDFFAVARFLFVTRFFGAEKLFFVARSSFVTGTIVPVPIPVCRASFGSWPVFLLLGGVEGVSERSCRMGVGAAGNYWWLGQNAFSEK